MNTDFLSAGLDCNGRWLALEQPKIMGILNVTPDSFSDGGRFLARQSAVAHARDMVAAGAAIVDVGGESTRPGAEPVAVDEELERVIPVLETLRAEVDCILSVDTSKPAVMAAAVAAGAGIINDVNGLRAEGALAAVAATQAAVCVMHMQGTPHSMQRNPEYADVVADVREFLLRQAESLRQVGVAQARIALDPGFGFGKTFVHNQALFLALPEFAALGYPILVGVSRKSMIGALLGDRPIPGRQDGSVAAALLAAQAGAAILRVHDVAATADALAVWRGLRAPLAVM